MGSIINPNERQTWAITASGITVMGKTKSYNTYEEMLRSPDPGLINYVADASGDPTVHKGFAVYRYSNGIFTKIYEGEMMDPDLGIIFDWDQIVNKPASTTADIDAAVALKHEHPNMETLNALSATADESGVINALMVNGILLATQAQIDELTAKVSGALSFKGVVENEAALPAEGNQVGDVYVTKDGKEFVYTETGFEEFGSTVDLSGYYTKEEIDVVCVKFQQNGDRKFILLNNFDNIVGKDTKGTAHNLIMVSKWDKADFGAPGLQLNLNSSARPTVNDKDPIVVESDLADYVKYEANLSDPSRPDRKVITLKNDDNICGYTTTNGSVNLVMVSKWDVADFGSTAVHMNLNSKDEITVNDKGTLVVHQEGPAYGDEKPGVNRKVIYLDNFENICGRDTNGTAHNLIMVSKWNVADFGATGLALNLNTKDNVTINDKDTVLTDANFGEFVTIPSIEGLATEASVAEGLAGKVDKEEGKGLSSNDFTAEEKAKLAGLANYDDTAVKAQIAKETEDRAAADSDLTAAIGLKQNVITVDGKTLTLTNDVLELGEDVVVLQNPWDPQLPNRRHIVLKNHDSIVGTMTNGENGTLIMMSKWDKVDIGTTKAQMNLNSPDGVIQVNDDAIVVTSANIEQYAPATDLSGYYTKVEVDAKVAGVLHYKGTVATVEELNTIEAPVVGDVYHVTADKGEYAYNGTAWEALGSEVDLSAYALKDEVADHIEVAKEAVLDEVEAETNARVTAVESLDQRVTGVEADLVNAQRELEDKIDTKVDKVEGKSLVDDAEISRLAGVTNYDDTEVKAAIALKQDKLNGSEFVTIDNNVVSLTDMVVNYAYDNTHTRKHIVLANHNSVVGTLADGSNNVSLVMLSKWDKADFGSTQVTMNLNTKDQVTINDKDVIVTDKDLAVVSGNVVSIKDRLVALEAQLVALKQTDVAAVTAAADLAQADKDLIITIAEPISGTTTVEGKSIEVKELTTSNATTIFKTEGDVTMKNLTTTGDLPKATANAQIRIVSGDYIRITDSTIDQTGYNAIEIGLGTGSGPMATKSITIDNVTFNSTLSNNAILIFATEDGSVVTISNCTFKKCSNPVRLSNAKGGKVTLNLVNCEFTEWDSNDMWAGIVIMQDYTSGSVEAIQANNLFGPDKVTINLINCTHAGEKITMPEDIATVCGTNDAATQLFYIWSNEEGLVAYDADRYPVINIQ